MIYCFSLNVLERIHTVLRISKGLRKYRIIFGRGQSIHTIHEIHHL